eukprot:CAMPEP_0173396282 /NCGR_PEP_ID=MMETSP1356-20130122/35045_1 /TAXON_ID=77927 ORGANISM="Hemiselmis virescens, Strain PCC157" /NCGR_SAMPLE_ID=MMETSP1356 /ASSEMBLY_ACC=CAM_ASM_000847 /LENGTH=97 /DNA_ID=CAMNT_0014355277 /DNA_START=51 /DNA_END=340 /DNA_ORIENTATION=+
MTMDGNDYNSYYAMQEQQYEFMAIEREDSVASLHTLAPAEGADAAEASLRMMQAMAGPARKAMGAVLPPRQGLQMPSPDPHSTTSFFPSPAKRPNPP